MIYEQPIAIPKTTINRYIGGDAALNIIFNSDDSGDWHSYKLAAAGMRPDLYIFGEGQPLNTNDLFGHYDIVECGAILNQMGVKFEGSEAYASTHRRSVLDMVIRSSLSSYRPMNTVIAGDYLCAQDSIEIVIEKLNGVMDKLTEHQRSGITWWINRNKDLVTY